MLYGEFLGFYGNFFGYKDHDGNKQYIPIDAIENIYAIENTYTEIQFHIGRGWRYIKFEIPLDEFMEKLSAHQNSPTLILKEINQKLDSIDQRLTKLEIDIEYAPGNDKSVKAEEHFVNSSQKN